MLFRGPRAGLTPRFIGTLSEKSGSLYDTPGRRRCHFQRGAALLFRREKKVHAVDT